MCGGEGIQAGCRAAVGASVAAAEAALNGSGRIVLRASGTEPLIRVVEGRDASWSVIRLKQSPPPSRQRRGRDFPSEI